MGEQDIKAELEGEQLRIFLKHVLDDIRALDAMIDAGFLECHDQHMGAEQELFLVDEGFRPAPAAVEILERIGDAHFTTEIAAFNLEVNLDPLPFHGACFREYEATLNRALAMVREAGAPLGVSPILAGILPTIMKSDLDLKNLTPVERYAALNRTMSRLRGEPYEFRIKGADELIIRHDSVMIEGCNTSFQVHLEVCASQFVRAYNIAQAIAGPVLSIATNSPLLFGKRLWRETRIALFQQSVDTRSSSDFIRERSPRVTFGSQWLKGSILELYRDDVSRFRVLIGAEDHEDPLEMIRQGKAPSLKSLRVFNGTVYRWNRPCYGISDGKPHLRIENRVFPAGPSIQDEVANAAFWLGLMKAFIEDEVDVTQRMEFDDAKMNFLVAARNGIDAQFAWFDKRSVPACELVGEQLVPIARKGLALAGIDEADVDRYLGIIEERASRGITGAQWLIRSFDGMRDQGKITQRLNALTSAMRDRQQSGLPVAQWELATIEESGGWKHRFLKIEDFMTTELFTVRADEPVDLVANLMDWRHIRHIPVEDDEHHLVGIISYRKLLRMMASGWRDSTTDPVPASAIMRTDPVTVTPDTPTIDAIRLMRAHGVSALPVVKDGKLLGVVTERDFMEVTARLLEESLERGS